MADDLESEQGEASTGRRSPADLAVDLRTSATVVAGYLELMSDANSSLSPEERRRTVASVERRLETMRRLIDELQAVCVVMRASAD